MIKRIVLEHVAGALKGCTQILGTEDQLKTMLSIENLPPILDPVNMGDHNAKCQLIRVAPRYILYRETTITPVAIPGPQPEQ